MPLLQYGLNRICRLELAEFTSIGPANATPCADPVAAVRAAMARPLDFPPLDQATTPGDRAVVAVPHAVPRCCDLLVGVGAGLCDAGVDPGRITLLTDGPLEGLCSVNERFAALGLEAITLAVHNPAEERQLAMIGTLDDGRPLRMNRALVEADVALLASSPSLTPLRQGRSSRYGGLYPHFAGPPVAGRVRNRERSGDRRVPADRERDVDRAGWLLGISFVVQAIPGPDGALANVIAGEPQAAFRAATSLWEELWARRAPRSGDLVVAALAGDQRTQSWAHVARAVSMAETVVSGDGAVVVCSELSTPPDRTLNQLRDADDYAETERRLRRDASAQAQTAQILAHALARRPVYLLSRLPPSTVESLGMTPVADEDELQHLARGRSHCVLLHEAQELALRPEDESCNES